MRNKTKLKGWVKVVLVLLLFYVLLVILNNHYKKAVAQCVKAGNSVQFCEKGLR